MPLTNLFQWSAQIALLTLAGAAVMRLVIVDSPLLRHAFWRALLLVCLILPAVQPRTVPEAAAVGVVGTELIAPAIAPAVAAAPSSGRVPLLAFRRVVARYWALAIGFVLAIGAAARLIWLAAGLLRLRRLCSTGEPALPDGEYDDLVARIHARAHVRYVSRIGQPVTYGLFRPVVLLPDSFPALHPPLQRAVLAHELWHVRRRDWAWVLIEECIRALFWFNPAVWWLVSKVQATREEVVDELTVQLTNGRKAYLEALLVFADEPTLFPAAPFARRRHLFQRMLLISREAVMSSRRIVASFVAAAGVVLAAGLYGASAFPLSAAAPVAGPISASTLPPVTTTRSTATAPGPLAASAAQNPVRDRRPGEPGPETVKEIELKRAIEADGSQKTVYFQLGVMQEARGARREADATWAMLRGRFPNDPEMLGTLARMYSWAGRFDDAVSALKEAATLDPTNPERHQMLATFYWEKASKDKTLAPTQVLTYVKAGIAATEQALTYDPDYAPALTFKSVLLRTQANLETDPAKQQALLAEAEPLQARALELNRNRPQGGVGGGVNVGRRQTMEFVAAPPPPPPPPPPGLGAVESRPSAGSGVLVDGLEPLRVGGNIKPPVKIRDVKPVYPPIAFAAGVTGVVILEATINTAGEVYSARVLRGFPLLDEAALEAVRQWMFTPTLLNNTPVPVIMTVTVNFTLQ